MKHLLRYVLPPLAYAAVIFHLSSGPVPSAVAPLVAWDKLAHVALYAGLGLLVARALRAAGLGVARCIAFATFVGGLYGLLDEVHQSFVPARSAEVADVLADLVGSAAGAAAWCAAAWAYRRRQRARAEVSSATAARAARREGFGVKDVFTTLNVLAGFAVLVLSMRGEVRAAAAAVFAGYVFDALDGFVARVMRSGNRFGAEYDNAADLVTYSIAPAFVVYAAYAPLLGPVYAGVLGACPLLGGVLRFARFNVQRIEFPGYWVGLPRPASAVLIVSFCAARLFAAPAFAWAGVAFIPLVSAMNLLFVPFHGHHRRRSSPVVAAAIAAWVGSTAVATLFGFVWEACLFWSAAYAFAQGLFVPAADRARFRAFVAAWRRGDDAGAARAATVPPHAEASHR